MKIFSFAFLLKIGTVRWRKCTNPFRMFVCTYIHTHVCIWVCSSTCVLYTATDTHTHRHMWLGTCACVCVSTSTRRKLQHCRTLVRFVFTRHWLHWFPSLDLDYVNSVILSLTLQGTHLDISSRRASDGTLLTHCF